MNRYFARVEYDGTEFAGWQVQPDQRTVQGSIEKALAVYLQSPIRVVGAGRTDAGVHGRGQALHFDTEHTLSSKSALRALNSLLPDDVALYDLSPVTSDFHARFSACSRRYRYYLSTEKHPLSHRFYSRVSYPVDWTRFSEELSCLPGERIFTSLCSSRCYTDNHRCRITEATLTQLDDTHFVVSLTADRFLYNMVRNIVGTVIDISRGYLEEGILEILEKRDRSAAGVTAPARGLVLEYVSYDT
ncbi:tRNA pseudouridine(38-40) synthase TruA [Chitinivibrio alkaliphilus]|uniref:tRNA pseudouridine synthase A n=1 Tax=Chitinivibrio alkaliphilus ACht1 TaxID=1313304 RepID=U7D5I5_9BACT|nr:tRNA pseudouridine(38-40) synthase TruA [Chitinivibrio alkaliphilus]ERP31789.1 tRNA pseudouridine synthase A [Chitinivibrio alkaliphilus ACht1]